MEELVRTGARLRSVTCTTQVIVVRAPDEGVDLRCGGRSMIGHDAPDVGDEGAPAPGFSGGSEVGKRYVDTSEELEVLCTSAGAGSLSAGLEVLELKSAKPLPASD